MHTFRYRYRFIDADIGIGDADRMDIKMSIFKNFPIGDINVNQCLIYISLFGNSCFNSVFLFRISGFCSQTLEIYWFRSKKATQAFAL